MGWPPPHPKSHSDVSRTGTWPGLTNKRHPRKLSGIHWASCSHSLSSLLNYQITNLKSLRCSSLPSFCGLCLKMKPGQETEPGDGKKWHFWKYHGNTTCAPECSYAWSQDFQTPGPIIPFFFFFFAWLTLHLVSVICNWRVPNNTRNHQGLDHERLQRETSKFALHSGRTGELGGVLSKGKTCPDMWDMVLIVEAGEPTPRPRATTCYTA